MNVGIIGAGAIGTLFGWHLAKTHDVTFVERRPDVVAALQEKGIRLDDESEIRRVTATTDNTALYGCNAIFLFVRATDTLRALRPFGGKLNPAVPIVSLQNGLGNEEAIKTALGGTLALVLGATTESAVTIEPGHSKRIGVGKTVCGTGGASPETVQRIVAMLEDCDLTASTVYDIRPHLWGKLIANAAINPVSALLDRPNGIILQDLNAMELSRALAQEAAAVASALRIPLPFGDPWTYVKEIVEQTAEMRNSMAYDLANGYKTEIDFINGAVVATGRRAAVPTPFNETITRLVKAREAIG